MSHRSRSNKGSKRKAGGLTSTYSFRFWGKIVLKGTPEHWHLEPVLCRSQGWSQNWVKIFYLYNVKIEPLTPSPLYLYRRIFTLGQLRPSRVWNISLRRRKPYPLSAYTKMIRENCLLHLGSIARVFMSFPIHYHWDLIMNFYLYRRKSSDPLPLYLYTVNFTV